MSISIDSTPSTVYNFAYRPLVYTVSSNDATVVRCLADIYINTVYSVTIEKSPDLGETDVFTFDVASVLQDNLKAFAPAFTDSTNKLYADANSATQYTIRFFEVLDSGTTFTTTWAEDGAGTGYAQQNQSFAFNGTFRHEETNDITDFLSGGSYSGLHRLNYRNYTFNAESTNKPRKIKRGDFAVMSSFYQSGSSIQARVIEYDNALSTVTTNITSTLASANRIWQYGFDTDIADSTSKYLLQRFETTAPVGITNYCLWELVDNCNDYVSLYWQNDVGGIDYYLFRDGQVKTIQGESETYTQPLTTSFNVYDFGTTVLSKSGDTGVSARSEVMDRTTADGLSNLFTHAVRAWIYDGTNFLPVIVADGSIDTIDTENGLYRANVELVYSNKHKAQRY